MKTKDKLDELEAQLDHLTNRIDNLRDKFVSYIEENKPKEPLIKDEMICKIIRAWVSENDSTRVVYYSPKNELTDSYGNVISFNLIFNRLKHGVEYTIDELCGEEE